MGELMTVPGEVVTLSTGRDVQTYHLAAHRVGTRARAPFSAAPSAANGAPAPVVYVHGLGGSSSNWWLLMPQLSDTFDQWAFDLPGFGDSPPSPPHSVEAYTADVVAFLESFDRPVHLVGNSMGGLIDVLVAAARPDLVASLTLIAPAMPQRRLPSAARAMAFVALPAIGERLIAQVNGVSAEEQVERLLRVMYGDPASVDDEDLAFAVEERRHRMTQPHADAVLLEALRSIVAQYILPAGRSAWRAAGRIVAPTLVLVGGHDMLVGAWSSRKWRRLLPRSRVVELASAGHVAMMEHPEVVADNMRSFLAAAHDADIRNPDRGRRGEE